jgi:hypothetical protein
MFREKFTGARSFLAIGVRRNLCRQIVVAYTLRVVLRLDTSSI